MESLREVTLRPWPARRKEELSLEEINSQVVQLTSERGHLRDITESSLERDIAAGQDVPDQVGQSADAKGTAKESLTQQEIQEKTFNHNKEIGGHLEWLRFAASNGLDMASLILSSQKRGQNPGSFSDTFREQGLNQGIPYGSFAISKEDHTYLQRNDAEKARIQDVEQRQEAAAKGARMKALDVAADEILKAAKQFEKEVQRETKYWQEIVSISEKGWPVQRMRQNARHVPFAVRFGLPEAGDYIKARGFAPLRMDADGSIVLDPALTRNPNIFRVRISVDSEVTGTSQLMVDTDRKDKSIEESIKLARDSLLDEELYREMTLETRQLSAFGVELRDAVIKVQAPQLGSMRRRQLLIDCIPRDEPIPPGQDHSDDWLAQLVAEASRLLLTHEHSMRLHWRSQMPPPLTSQKRDRQTPPLLRPLLAVFYHMEGVDALYTYLQGAADSFSSAGLDNSLNTTRESSWAELSRTLSTSAKDLSSTDRLLEIFKKPFEGKATMSIPTLPGSQPETLSISTTTIIGQPLFGTEHKLSLPSSLITELGLVAELKFTSVEELKSYLDWILSMHIAQHIIKGSFSAATATMAQDSMVKISIKPAKKGSVVHRFVSVNVSEGSLEVKASDRTDHVDNVQAYTWAGKSNQPALIEWIKSLAE